LGRQCKETSQLANGTLAFDPSTQANPQVKSKEPLEKGNLDDYKF